MRSQLQWICQPIFREILGSLVLLGFLGNLELASAARQKTQSSFYISRDFQDKK